MAAPAYIKMEYLHPNNGQLEGLPTNPRFIRDEKFRKLVQSIRDDPEMLEIRELLVYDTEDPVLQYVIICGNMRFRAMKDLGYREAPCKILSHDFPMEKIRRILLKDNSSFGETDFDLLINEWSLEEIDLAAIDVPGIDVATEEEEEASEEMPEEPVTKPGEVWQLGDHKLVCGEETIETDVIIKRWERLTGNKAKLISKVDTNIDDDGRGE